MTMGPGPRPPRPAPPRPGEDRRDRRPVRKRPKAPVWTKLAIVLGALVMVASGGVAVGPRIAAWWALRGITQLPDPIPSEVAGETLEGSINFLLLGLDYNLEASDGSFEFRTDSIMLVHVPSTHDAAYMISFPRDLAVDIPALPETGYGGQENKINAAFQTGARSTDRPNGGWGEVDVSPEGLSRGIAQVMRTISNLVPGGLQFHGSAIIDFEGFDKVVEAVGGVHLCVDQDVWSIHYRADGTEGDPGWQGRVYNSGGTALKNERKFYAQGECRDFAPWEALDYSRQRVGLPDGDYDRQRHQQQLIKAIIKKVASPDTLTNLGTLSRLQEATGDLLTIGLGGHPVQDWLWTFRNLRADDLVMVRTYAGESRPYTMRGEAAQSVDPDLVQLLQAVQTDTVLNFLDAHLDWVAPATPDTGPAPTTTG
jgi:anionic cell wall polymer biosynthesis LytR-Cps2A-Psr (LCP) family protein